MNIAKSGKELINICQKEQISLSEYAIRKEVEAKGCLLYTSQHCYLIFSL